MEVLATDRMLTELDHVRLTNLVQRQKRSGPSSAEQLPLEQVLDAADIVPWQQVPPSVVTMHSRILLKDLKSGSQNQLTLCYPVDADASAGFVSVMSPVGWSLLGQKVGATVRWPTPMGGELSGEILGILFQPESSGAATM